MTDGMGSPLRSEKSIIIEVKGVRRLFRSPKKSDGFSGFIKLLFKPEYQYHEALKNIHLKIDSGAFVGLIGANGAGKTTLLKILSGLIPPSSGSARVLEEDPFKRTIPFRQKISLVMGQKAQLWWDLPASDAFDLLRAIYEIPYKIYQERLNTLSELLDVKRHLRTQIRRLSLGERMKMELIGAILHWPKVIFLDEPTIGLDVLAAHHLREFLKVFNEKEGATILLTSHNMEDIERLCSRVLILQSGELIYDGEPSGLIAQGERRLGVSFLKTPSQQELLKSTDLVESEIESSVTDEHQGPQMTYFNLNQDRIIGTLQNLMNRYTITDIKLEEQSLETVIKRLYQSERMGKDKSH